MMLDVMVYMTCGLCCAAEMREKAVNFQTMTKHVRHNRYCLSNVLRTFQVGRATTAHHALLGLVACIPIYSLESMHMVTASIEAAMSQFAPQSSIQPCQSQSHQHGAVLRSFSPHHHSTLNSMACS